MATLTGRARPHGLRSNGPAVRTTKARMIAALRAALIAGIAAGVMLVSPAQNAQDCSINLKSDCPINDKIDLVFVVDNSGSIAGRGQTHNIEIDGIARALGDSMVIPRNGSVAVGVVTFNRTAVVRVPLTEIRTNCDAELVASQVAALKCAALESGVPPCPVDDTSYGAAISAAEAHLRQARPAGHPRYSARRIMLMSSDGMPTINKGVEESIQLRNQAANEGVRLELDAILMGVDLPLPVDELKQNLINISFRVPVSAGQPLIQVIKPGACSGTGSGGADCDRQAGEFARAARNILRSGLKHLDLVVDTEEDPASGNKLSLRQAIETANCNGGATIITFTKDVKTIHPVTPLPALIAPDIVIDGCNVPDCSQPVTIDGSGTDSTKGEQHGNGILIRSNHDEVRNIRIIHFKGAGVAVAQLCLNDITGSNKITSNTFEDNVKAGVCVQDLVINDGQDGLTCFPLAHNVGNTISMNRISGSKTPIDLGCDGPTANDDEDKDDGPNRLLNHPEPFTVSVVSVTNNVVTVSGKAAAGARVEIFAVNKFRPENGKGVVDSVVFFRKADASSDGTFTFTGTSESPCDGYAATVTDSEGNTSEMTPNCAGPPVGKLSDDRFKFGPLDPSAASGSPDAEFTIENCGCSPLDLSSLLVRRTGEDVASRRISDANDSCFFQVPAIGSFSANCAFGAPSGPMRLAPGEHQDLRVQFKPAIPKPVNKEAPVFAVNVLPDRFTSMLAHDGTRFLSELRFIGRVTTDVKLIDPDDPQNPAKVLLSRSEDELSVEFAIFDSNLDVTDPRLTVDFQFFDRKGKPVPLDQPTADLASAIKARQLIAGQSFRVIQKFKNANQHPKVDTVRVTVRDADSTQASATSGSIVSSAARGVRSAGSSRKDALSPPVLNLTFNRARPSTAK